MRRTTKHATKRGSWPAVVTRLRTPTPGFDDLQRHARLSLALKLSLLALFLSCSTLRAKQSHCTTRKPDRKVLNIGSTTLAAAQAEIVDLALKPEPVEKETNRLASTAGQHGRQRTMRGEEQETATSGLVDCSPGSSAWPTCFGTDDDVQAARLVEKGVGGGGIDPSWMDAVRLDIDRRLHQLPSQGRGCAHGFAWLGASTSSADVPDQRCKRSGHYLL